MTRSRGGWFRSGRYRPRWLEQDLELVLAFYTSLGFLDARIAEKEVRWSGDRRSVDIRIRIEEGVRTRIASVRFEGLPDVPESEIRAKLALQEGKPHNRALLSRDRARIQSVLAERGYAEASVEAEEALAKGWVDLLYRVEAGPRVRIGSIAVAGTSRTSEKFVRRELTFGEGDWFRLASLLDSRDRIYQTGLYSNVAITREGLNEDDAVPIRIDVAEKKVRSIGVGGGFGTEDRFRVSLDWSDRNLLGSGRRLAFETVLSNLYSDRPFEQKHELSLIEPWMFGTRTVGLWKVSHRRVNIENGILRLAGTEERVIGRYRLNETATSFSLSRDFSKTTKGWVTHSLEWADAGDPTFEVDPEVLEPDVTRSLSVNWERDARDHLIDPTRGSRSYATIEFAGRFLGGDNEYLRETGGLTSYRRLGGRAVLATRLQAGSIRSLADVGALPDYKLFRLGGANSVRGYREETIGPGNHLLLASAELRLRLFWRFGAVVFADGGNAWQEIGDITGESFRIHARPDEATERDFRYGVGGGLRLYTPVGPLRMDYGYKLKRLIEESGEREPDDVLHFSIGQAF